MNSLKNMRLLSLLALAVLALGAGLPAGADAGEEGALQSQRGRTRNRRGGTAPAADAR